MEPVKRAAELIQDVEAKLRSLVSEAAASGDYQSVVQIAAWARTLSALLQGTGVEALEATAPTVRTDSGGAREGPPKQHAATSRPGRDYPKFFRQDDMLVRLAWSKREKREYRHKSPYFVLKFLAKLIADVGWKGRVFSTEQILPLRAGENGAVPNYQAYVGISLLKHAGLIDQHGRQGYSIPRPSDFNEAVEAVWKKLPELQNP
jgi:hypothetical protein